MIICCNENAAGMVYYFNFESLKIRITEIEKTCFHNYS